jgi:hypothetical protein
VRLVEEEELESPVVLAVVAALLAAAQRIGDPAVEAPALLELQAAARRRTSDAAVLASNADGADLAVDDLHVARSEAREVLGAPADEALDVEGLSFSARCQSTPPGVLLDAAAAGGRR